MASNYKAAEAFPPGEYLRDELEARDWTQSEFAEIIGRPAQVVSEILNAKKEITPETAVAVSEALGTSAEVWLNLQTRYRLFLLRSQRTDTTLTPVERRARLRTAVPLAEARRRGWLPDTDDLDVLEAAACDLLEIASLDEESGFAAAARRSNTGDPISLKQTAWLGRVRRVAAPQPVAEFDTARLAGVAPSLPRHLEDGPDRLTEVPALLAACGVRLVFCEGLRSGKLDGAVSFLADGRPVIGLTTRGDRFDSLLFTLLHECAHLVLGHITPDSGPRVDVDLAGGTADPDETEANRRATEWLFPGGFTTPGRSLSAVMDAAVHHRVHPSVIIGQIQWRTQNHSLHRARIPRVRPTLESANLMT